MVIYDLYNCINHSLMTRTNNTEAIFYFSVCCYPYIYKNLIESSDTFIEYYLNEKKYKLD